MWGAPESSRLWRTVESGKHFRLSSKRLLQFWLAQTDTHIIQANSLLYWAYEPILFLFVFCFFAIMMCLGKSKWSYFIINLWIFSSIHVIFESGEDSSVDSFLDNLYFKRIARLEMMLPDVFLLHFSALISAENILSPLVSGSDDVQLQWLSDSRVGPTWVGFLSTSTFRLTGARPGTSPRPHGWTM